MPQIHFLDVTNRDGVQTARTGLSKFGKTMVNFYLGRLGVAQSEIGFPFLFHEVPYVRAQTRAGSRPARSATCGCQAGAGPSPATSRRPRPLGLRHYNLSISTSDQMLRGSSAAGSTATASSRRWSRRSQAAKAGRRRRPSASTPRTARGPTTGSSPSSRSPPGRRGPTGVRYCDTIGGDTPGRIGERFAALAGRDRACRWRRTATTTSAWPSPTRWPARSATWRPGRTRGSTRASTGSASGPATPT